MLLGKRLAPALWLMLFVWPVIATAAGKRPVTFEDIMKFKAVSSPCISDNGRWIAFTAAPDRGDPEVTVKSLMTDTTYRLERGSQPVISRNSLWVAAALVPKAIDMENADKDKPKKGMQLLNLSNGKITKFENVRNFTFSNDSRWIAYQLGFAENIDKDSKLKDYLGSDLVLRHLDSGSELVLQSVSGFAFDSVSGFIAYAVSEQPGKRNGLYYIDLKNGFAFPTKIIARDSIYCTELTWNNRNGMLAFIKAKAKKDVYPDSITLCVWDSKTKEVTEVVAPGQVPDNWKLPFKNPMYWSKDGNRLFFGYRPVQELKNEDEKVTYNDSTFYDINTIRKKTELDVWHWNDPRIKTNQKNWWDNNKDKTFAAVYNLETKKHYQLADLDISFFVRSDSPDYTIAYNEAPYLKELNWYGELKDLYVVDIRTGTRKLVATRLIEDASCSPGGKFVVYYKDGNWHLYDVRLDTTRSLTSGLNVAFSDEQWDQPGLPPSYGVAGWLDNDEAVIIYDRYDIWKFYTGQTGSRLNQTAGEGRKNRISFRITNLDPDKQSFNPTESQYVTGFDERTKSYGIYSIDLDMIGITSLLRENNKRFRLISKAREAGKILFSRESYDEFPDLWVSDTALSQPIKHTNVNPQMENYLWGKTELVRWANMEGDSLDGYIIKPDNFEEGKLYPVIIYYYETFSETMNFFYQPRINHRPCYPVYSGDGYLIFVPDIRYRPGQPGYSCYSAVVSGVRHLAEMGMADTNAVGIQGHSWGGYETAYLVTKTNMFAAAVAGAPVGNMTSAYSGIRLESGLPRMFQYEAQQSRIGGTLWDSLRNYIDNSPIFNAPNAKTPLLIEFGDEDEAVPFQQGVELYMAMRRLNKNCIMLQYNREPHHPRKYQNKLDYAIKMKEFFDTYIKKTQAPEWILKGVEYKGKP